MPLYNLACLHPLNTEQRQKVASTITDIHCRETEALPEFVNVVFLDHYPLPQPQVISLLGGVRSGGNRTPEAIAQLQHSLQLGIADALSVRANQVGMSLVGVAANWVVEGGEVMPDPGDESEWQARRQKNVM